MSLEPAHIFRAAAFAGALSGVPSTLHAFTIGMNPLESSLAAGSILRPDEPDGPSLLATGLATHACLSLGWTVVLSGIPGLRGSAVRGALAGLAIGVTDLGVADRVFPRIAALPRGAQLADHMAFGALVALALGRNDRARPAHQPTDGRNRP